MNGLHDILSPTWDTEKWILACWTELAPDEQALIQTRMNELFGNGLPFELHHDKLFYIYTFSLLTLIELVGVQSLIKFLKHTPNNLVRQQLLDEMFHCMVFAKIAYLLSSPYAAPPDCTEHVIALSQFIINDDCPKVGCIFLSLIGEGSIEGVFHALGQAHVAPEVFSVVLADEQRHMSEVDLYQSLTLDEINILKPKFEYLEKQLVALFSRHQYALSLRTLLGEQINTDFVQNQYDSYRNQLAKIKLSPSKTWRSFINVNNQLPRLKQFMYANHDVEMTQTRRLLMTQWGNPNDPTMVGEFDVDVSCLSFFNKQFPPETLTGLMLQVVSQGLADTPSFRNYLSHKKLYQSDEAYVAIAVKLPGCGDQISAIIFENCHTMPLHVISQRIKKGINMMTFCYHQREAIEKQHPHLKTIADNMLYDINYGTYPYPFTGSSIVSISNIGANGYVRTKSPLRSNESMKYTLLEVQRKQVWNNQTKTLELLDILPVSISADHRIFDGNLPVPKLVNSLFQQKFREMCEANSKQHHKKNPLAKKRLLDKILQENLEQKWLGQILQENLELGHRLLSLLQNIWPDFASIDTLF